MFKKILFVGSLALTLAIPTSIWAKESCSCMTSSSMGKCQGADHMMMEKLGKKDGQYDKRFIDLMIPHHEAAIMMAKDALKNATHPEIKEMAQQIINSQEKEIEQLKTWRKKWYGNEQSKGE